LLKQLLRLGDNADWSRGFVGCRHVADEGARRARGFQNSSAKFDFAWAINVQHPGIRSATVVRRYLAEVSAAFEWPHCHEDMALNRPNGHIGASQSMQCHPLL
jgi:hypothetical protein